MKVDFSTVLMDLKGKEALRMQVEAPVLSEDGTRIVKPAVTEDMTLESLTLSAMQQMEDRDPGPKRSNFGLLVRIAQGGVVEITATERDLILMRIAKYYPDVPFGRADEILNAPPTTD